MASRSVGGLMTYEYRNIVDDAESIARRKLEGMPREDILSYEVGLLRGVIQTLCKILNVQEGTIEAQTVTIEAYKRTLND